MPVKHHVFMYHHVAPTAGRESLIPYVVTPEVFLRQLDAIVASRLPVVTMAELLRRQSSQTNNEGRCVVLTFDDCSRELWDFAIPELEKRGMNATFYAVASRFGADNDWDDHRGGRRIPLMTEKELHTLAVMGHEVGSHGVTHRRLTELKSDEVLAELVDSKQMIESVTGIVVETLAYPFGAVPKNHQTLCRTAGYKCACSIFSRAATIEADPFAVRRILAHEADTGWRMRVKLSRPYLDWRCFRDPVLIRRGEAAAGDGVERH